MNDSPIGKPMNRWQNKRYICLVRQSNDSEGSGSTEGQLRLLHQEGERRGMRHIDDVVLTGATGSLPGKRQDLQDFLERKREHDDFDVLLIQRLDRLTRGGSDHGIWFTFEAIRVGVEILYAADDLPENGAYRNMIMAANLLRDAPLQRL